MSNSPQKSKSTYREIYESQNDCSVSGVAIKINCENCDSHLVASSSANLNEIQCPMPSSSSAQSSSSFHEHIGSQKNGSNKLFNKQPQTSNPINSALDDDIVELPEVEYPIVEPIVIRGDGSITLFGLSNMFCTDFPSLLIGRIAKEEFHSTITKINALLKEHHNLNLKLMFFGCLCCCCSLGCSLLWPTLALSKRTRSSLEKLLAEENNRLYNKLGFNWKLNKETSHSNSAFMEYVILIEFSQKLQIYRPD